MGDPELFHVAGEDAAAFRAGSRRIMADVYDAALASWSSDLVNGVGGDSRLRGAAGPVGA
jgi:hypothetical protein